MHERCAWQSTFHIRIGLAPEVHTCERIRSDLPPRDRGDILGLCRILILQFRILLARGLMKRQPSTHRLPLVRRPEQEVKLTAGRPNRIYYFPTRTSQTDSPFLLEAERPVNLYSLPHNRQSCREIKRQLTKSFSLHAHGILFWVQVCISNLKKYGSFSGLIWDQSDVA